MMEWSPLDGLTTEANALFAEEWSLLDWLLNNSVSASPVEVAEVLGILIRNDERLSRLGIGKYSRGNLHGDSSREV